MWSVWLIVCVCGFHFVCPLIGENKSLAEASWWRGWLWGKLGLALVGGAMITSVQLIRLLKTPWTAAHQPSLSITNSPSLLKLMSIESDAIQPSNPLLSPSPPAFYLSQHQGLFHWVSSLHQVVKVLELQFQHQSFQWIGLISFRIDWFDLLSVQGSVNHLQALLSKSLIQFFLMGGAVFPPCHLA